MSRGKNRSMRRRFLPKGGKRGLKSAKYGQICDKTEHLIARGGAKVSPRNPSQGESERYFVKDFDEVLP